MQPTHLGRANITATVIADSTSENNTRLVTLEIEYPRFILAELNTHRMLSKNSASSRAIPVDRMLELQRLAWAQPVEWGKNQAGMQAQELVDEIVAVDCASIWRQARDDMHERARELQEYKVHKQVVNRLTEPWQIMKTVISATEWDNLWLLRCHADAQPEFQELARTMRRAIDHSKPQTLRAGEWHLPYVEHWGGSYWLDDVELTVEDALELSVSCCAQVSYRRLDQTLVKAKQIYQRLIESEPAHLSPTEHQATPIATNPYAEGTEWPQGTTHQTRDGSWWSGNFRDWAQLRHFK